MNEKAAVASKISLRFKDDIFGQKNLQIPQNFLNFGHLSITLRYKLMSTLLSYVET